MLARGPGTALQQRWNGHFSGEIGVTRPERMQSRVHTRSHRRHLPPPGQVALGGGVPVADGLNYIG
jgi:hypothetical protein